MENIAEILKNAPKGLKLYSPMVGVCEFENFINIDNIVISYYHKEERLSLSLDKYGRWKNEGACLLFPCYDKYDWDCWQYDILRNNTGFVFIDKKTGYKYISINCDGFKWAVCDVFGKIHTEISPLNFCFADADTEFQFLSQLRENGYYYNDGDIFYDEKNEQKNSNSKKASHNDYKKIIEHYGVRQQLKKLSEEVYELQEAIIDLPCDANGWNNEHITEEIADVMVLLKQFEDYFKITPEMIAEIMVKKVDRTLNRIKEEK